ncbi:MAG: hypothetical protein V4557_01200 [Bacteroidota bacterium]
MTYDYPQQSYLSKSILSGVFAGIVATLSNLGFDLFFRKYTQFMPSQIINVATIIFATMLFFSVAGLLYFFASKFIKQGVLVYVLIFIIFTIFCFNLGLHINRSSDPKVTADFRMLFLGLATITCVLATFLIPYLMKHQSIFLDEFPD